MYLCITKSCLAKCACILSQNTTFKLNLVLKSCLISYFFVYCIHFYYFDFPFHLSRETYNLWWIIFQKLINISSSSSLTRNHSPILREWILFNYVHLTILTNFMCDCQRRKRYETFKINYALHTCIYLYI